MKRLLITLLAALFAGGAFAQTAFPDIPEGHWAGEAVGEIADLGIVIGFPDGTFRGNEAFTRYQAALVVSRLLDVINEDLDARLALSEEDMASLRNALQELASDVAAQGVRLSDVESSVASLSDDVTTNQSRLDELESMLEGIGDTDPDVVRDLLNQLASQRVALDTAQAQAEAAEALANDALSAANAAAARARANEESISALNSVVQGLGDRVTALEQAGRAPAPDGGPALPGDLADRVTRNEADIANIREFVILLRRDQVALRDRVSSLEAADAVQAAQIETLEERVTALEENPLGFTGSISVDYEVQRLIGTPFDVDRAYGLNNERDMGASVFSTGAAELDGDASTAAGYQTEVGEVAQDREDMDGVDTPVTASLDLSADFGNVFDAQGSPSALNQFSAAVSLNLVQVANPTLTDPDGDPINMPFVFSVDEFTVTFDPIGGNPISFMYGEEVNVQLTPYVFELEDERGFVVSIGAPDFLSFLGPEITGAYTSRDTDTDGELDTFEYGVRLALSPIEGFTLGGTYATLTENAEDKDDVLDNNEGITVYGVDASVSLSIFSLGVEWANSTFTDQAGNTDTRGVLYATLDVDGSGLPLVDSLSANYRDIPGDWTAFGLTDNDEFVFAQDQAGVGFMAGLELFILDVDGYFDMYETGSPQAEVMAFGVDATASLFAGFELGGFFHQISVNGTTVDAASDPQDENENLVVSDVERDNDYDTGFGVELRHDGDAPNALIGGLNLAAGYSQMEADFSRTEIFAEADVELDVSILSLTPYVAYESINDADTGSDDTNEIRAGTGLSTDPLGVLLAPSLEAAVNYRTTTHSDAADYTATELQWSVGLMLNEFLFDNSTFTAKYGSWNGTNINSATNTRGAGDSATDISGGDENNGLTQSVSGYELIWSYFDLQLAYGVYVSDMDTNTAGNESSGQAFSISYTVDF